ncbi:MAG: sigma-54 dependent transcriptional regulator [Gemmatimonadetes bacterium]|nr:sigma-54 dependent transcriptional regulator [Gemmatimonadota bacterium]
MTKHNHDPHLLIADDQPDVLEALRMLLKSEGFSVDTVTSPAKTLSAVESREYDLLLMDMNYTRDTTSGIEGLDLLSRIQALDSNLPVVVMTAWGSVEGAVECMRRGAKDYVEKPWDDGRLLATLGTQLELGRALRRSQRLEDENRRLRRDGLPDFIAGSKAMKPVLQLMERIAPSDANVLITGEHGTGKEVTAQWLHAASERAGNALVTVNAAGLSEGVFESEIFGHVRGAFTDAKTDRVGCFELADGGTLFMDEVANVGPREQAKLLRVIETGELQRVGSSKMRRVDVRILSATNSNVVKEVQEGRFREDLLYRLNTVEIHLPPLRDRVDDIPALAQYYLARLTDRYRKSLAFDAAAMQALTNHTWPGNIRELAHVVERSILMAQGNTISVGDLGLRPRTDSSSHLEGMTIDDAEKHLIQKALERYAGNVSDAAESLGLSRSALYRRLQRHGINADGP